MSWDLIGGDPAPGSPEAVGTAAGALAAVATLAEGAANLLHSNGNGLDPSSWSGAAAAAFRAEIHDLPQQLSVVTASYRDATSALRSYQGELEAAQAQARGALAEAVQAASDENAAERSRQTAQDEADAYGRQLAATNAAIKTVRHQLSTSVDPQQQSTLTAQLANLCNTANSQRANLRSAEDTAARHSSSRDDAARRLGDACVRADQIREDLQSASHQLAQALKAAEREAHLPNLLARTLTVLKEDVETYGPVVLDSLNLGATIFSTLALVFPPGAAVFTAAALVCGGAFVLGSLLVDSLRPGGITEHDLLALGMQTLGLLASATVVGRAWKIGGSAERLAVDGKWLGRAASGGQLAMDVHDHGLKGGLIDVGGMFVGRVGGHFVEKLGAQGVRTVIGDANKNPAIRRTLTAISRDIGKSDSQLFKIPLVSEQDSRYAQSLLGSGRLQSHGGQFLPGHSPGGKLLRDHALSQHSVDERTGDTVEEALRLDDRFKNAADHLLGVNDSSAVGQGGQ